MRARVYEINVCMYNKGTYTYMVRPVHSGNMKKLKVWRDTTMCKHLT